jgi:four helix bundle protein
LKSLSYGKKQLIDLSAAIHALTLTFPKEELFILTSQIKRAADSVALNIAEGSTGQSNAEFSRFIGYALRSNIEVVSCIYLAQKRNMIDPDNFQRIYQQCEEILVMLNSLRNTLK